MNTLRFGKVVQDPDVEGIEVEEEVPVPWDLAEKLECAMRDDGDANLLETLINQIPPQADAAKSPTKKGDTLLHVAAELGYAKCARALVEKAHIPVDIALSDKTQPVHVAAAGAHEACLAYLLEAGASLDARNNNGETPMHICAKVKDVGRRELYMNCIKRMLEAGADINVRDTSENTPLLCAAARGDEEMVKFLLKNNADPRAKDMFNHDAMYIAEDFGHMKLVAYFKKGKGAKGSKDGCLVM
mmetsp:Transcript_20519/g.78625  ORF Transcript_20519/g.78625 Transcript_20519/m.78625 type:complete len:244 (-) Transcript_20519:81-812(-)